MMERVIWVCDDTLVKNECVSGLNISIPETEVLVALNQDIEVPCVVQWRILWFRRIQDLIKDFQPTAQKFRNSTKL